MGIAVIDPQHPAEYWNVILVEDNADLVRQMEEFFSRKKVAGRSLRLITETDWPNAFRAIQERKADLFILDIYRGEAHIGGERVGEQVLRAIRSSGFVPVILHTNLPEGLEEHVNKFVRLVPKEQGLPALWNEIVSIFETRVPQMHHAIATHMDHALRDYMWDFVVSNWGELSVIADKPEFVRVLLQRLSISLASKGVDAVLSTVFPELGHSPVAEDKVHPADFYIKPPLNDDPMLGDVRLRSSNEKSEYSVVLWPTCDMVSVHGRVPKTEKVLCAIAKPLHEFAEYKAYNADPNSKSAQNRLVELLKNNRDKSPDRYHFLPGLCDIPDLVVDFQDLEHPSLTDVKRWRCLGSLRSPYAESLSVRFEKYRNRIGTPDLDNEIIVKRCRPMIPVIAGAASEKPGTLPASSSSSKKSEN